MSQVKIMLKCYQCDFEFTDEWILKNYEEDDYGNYWDEKKCGIAYCAEHNRIEITNIYFQLLARYKILIKQQGNQLIDRWAK
jgi:hypothetical protein